VVFTLVMEDVAPSKCAQSNVEVANERALFVLERLLALSVRILAGETHPLAALPSCIEILERRLCELHDALKLCALAGRPNTFAALAARAERRERADRRALAQLASTLAHCPAPRAVGRALAISVLVLSSNLSEDERSARVFDDAVGERCAA
jgi:hypothetical protein